MNTELPAFLRRQNPGQLRAWAAENRRLAEEGYSKASHADLIRWEKELKALAEKQERGNALP